MYKILILASLIGACFLLNAGSNGGGLSDKCHLKDKIGKQVTLRGKYKSWSHAIDLSAEPNCWVSVEPVIVGTSGEVVQTTSYVKGPPFNLKSWKVHTTNRQELSEQEGEVLVKKLGEFPVKDGDLVQATGRLCHLTMIYDGGALPCPFNVPDSHYFFGVNEVKISVELADQK